MTSSLLPSPRLWPRIACACVLLAACASCSMDLRPQPESGGQSLAGQLAGQWRLESPAREVLARNLRAVLEQARTREEERERRRYPYSIPPDEAVSGAASPPRDGMQAGPGLMRRNNWEMREQLEHQAALLNAVLPSNNLQIVQGPGRLEMLPDSGGWRRFTMGVNSTRVTSYATFRIASGWQKDVFVVHSRDGERNINIVERYRRIGGRALHLQVELSMPNAKEQIFAADYVLAQP